MIPKTLLLAATSLAFVELSLAEPGTLALRSITDSQLRFGGVIGERIDGNEHQWLLTAPIANPGMIEMFRVRDRQPPPNLVDWAGEFAGKFLISATQATRLTARPELREFLSGFTRELISTQAEDGYLGPFPKADRLLTRWDLWGHYHVIEGLLLWSDAAKDSASLDAAKRIADLACRTFLDGKKRVIDAGSPEMNMAFHHALGLLYQRTREPRYLQLAREIEKDWERAGDYLRTGLDGLEFHATPRPRWESLHDLQGLFEMWKITGETKYRRAFEHHWRSILRGDIHNAGSFSAGEQATGNPWATGAIETCCTIAWMALSIDLLQLTGDPLVADELERSTFNGALGAQHPTGRWWTYNTPMDGAREASAHSIVFQSRAGTPELNCCSVNGPRALGMLTDWAVMGGKGGVAINWLGPLEFTLPASSGEPVRVVCETDYPLGGRVKWKIVSPTSAEFAFRFRVPAWSEKTSARLNGEPLPAPRPGSYLEIKRRWSGNEVVELDLDFSVRALAGGREAAGKVSLFRGPLLLAWDQRHNPFDEAGIPPLALDRLADAKVTIPPRALLRPWLLLDLAAADGKTIRVCDYASAGASGTRYRSWLPAANPLPPPPTPLLPRDHSTVGTEPVTLRWHTNGADASTRYTVSVFEDGQNSPAFTIGDLRTNSVAVPLAEKFTTAKRLRWRVDAQGAIGASVQQGWPMNLQFDPAEKSSAPKDAAILRAPLRRDSIPTIGQLARATDFTTSEESVQLDGAKQMLVFSSGDSFRGDFTVAVRVRVNTLPAKRSAQIFSAWTAPMDDPLRLVVEGPNVFARIEAGQGFSTDALPIPLHEWHHFAAVKSGDRLTLYQGGEARRSVSVPAQIQTQSTDCAIGGNPRFDGPEFLAANFRDLEIHRRALSPEEVARLAGQTNVQR